VPLATRAPQRQAYRLVELARFSTHLGVRLNLHPKFFPVAGDAAARLIIAVDVRDGTEAAMRLCSAVFAAIWVEDRDIADQQVLAGLVDECGLAAERLQDARDAQTQDRYEAYTKAAIEAQVFGAPSYVINGEIFWGQDRLDFVERALSRQG
jgi:2-hydroxychromene-2-carboxylate isomerase